MGEIKVHEFISFDGVIDAPTWTFDFGFDPKMGETLAALTGSATAILLGRTTYEMFEPAWSTRTVEDDPGAPFFNDTMKYVVSSDADRADVAQLAGHRLRRGPRAQGAGRATSTSPAAARSCARMLADGLVDELDLFVYPVTRGDGPRLFEAGDEARTFTVANAVTYANGVVHLAYRPA